MRKKSSNEVFSPADYFLSIFSFPQLPLFSTKSFVK